MVSILLRPYFTLVAWLIGLLRLAFKVQLGAIS